MPFFKRFDGPSTFGGTPSATKVRDAQLTQEDDFWAGQWLYILGSGGTPQPQVSWIEGFLANSDELIPERNLSPVPAAGASYEIQAIWSAFDIHDAINQAIDDAFPAFFDVVLDESQVYQEDKLTYDLSGLATAPWVILKAWIERNTSVVRGTATSGAANHLTDTSLIGNLGSVTSAWKISIYDGTGKGQLRSVASVDNALGKVTPSVNWATTPDTTSKYALWDPTDEVLNWKRIDDVAFDAKEWPGNMYIQGRRTSLYGMRFRLQYLARPARLTTDAATTVVPSEFILHKALSVLFTMKTRDNRFDASSYRNDADYQRQLAELYKRQNAFEMPEGTLWQEYVGAEQSVDPADPLGWEDG